MYKVLFVCTGNTCRSPMAQMILQDFVNKENLQESIIVESAGVSAFTGGKMTDKSKQALEKMDVLVTHFVSKDIRDVIDEEFSLILTMTESHKKIIIENYCFARDRVFTLSEFAGEKSDVLDPFGLNQKEYDECAKQIKKYIKKAFDKMSTLNEKKSVDIAIGSDHGGYLLKEAIKKMLEENNISFTDYGTYSCDSVDYPDIAQKVCAAINDGKHNKGILICGTGIGISIAANKINGIRAALCSDVFSAVMSREHNNANVLCLGERVTGVGLASMIVEKWLETNFSGGRHELRVNKIKALEN